MNVFELLFEVFLHLNTQQNSAVLTEDKAVLDFEYMNEIVLQLLFRRVTPKHQTRFCKVNTELIKNFHRNFFEYNSNYVLQN